MLSRFFIQRPKFALVISIILTLAGAISVVDKSDAISLIEKHP